MMKSLITAGYISICISAGVTLPTLTGALAGADFASVSAQTESKTPTIKTKKVPSLRNKVYTLLAGAQKLADEGDVTAALKALDSVKNRSSSMNEYEKAMMWNFYGFIYYNNGQTNEAINSFKKVIAEQAIPDSLKQSTLYSLAQLSMQQELYAETIEFLNQWKAINKKPVKENFYVLRSQANYGQKNYQEALSDINEAVRLIEFQGKIPKENWLTLKRALHYSLKQPKKVTEVMEQLVRHYSKPEYWVQLGGMYGEIAEEKKQLAILEAAYQQGYIKKRQDFLNLSQVYMFNGLSYKAANLIIDGLEKQILEKSERNYSFVAEALSQAREDEKSAKYFKLAGELAEHGKYEQRLAETYVNMEKYDEAADYAREALSKGGLRNESNVYVALGMSQYNLDNFDAAILAFEQAEKHKAARKVAKQWIQFVKREKANKEKLKTALL